MFKPLSDILCYHRMGIKRLKISPISPVKKEEFSSFTPNIGLYPFEYQVYLSLAIVNSLA